MEGTCLSGLNHGLAGIEVNLNATVLSLTSSCAVVSNRISLAVTGNAADLSRAHAQRLQVVTNGVGTLLGQSLVLLCALVGGRGGILFLFAACLKQDQGCRAQSEECFFEIKCHIYSPW